MQNIILLLALLFIVQGISCNDNILSKFHQHTYKLKDVRVQLMNYSKDYFNFLEIKPFKYNRTTTAHNGTINFKVDASYQLEVVVQARKFLSNEYRHFPVRFQVNVKKSFDANALGFGKLLKCGNITSMNFYKDITYRACNFMVDETQLPPLIPSGKYRVELTFLFLTENIGMLHFYTEIYTPIDYPKK